MEFLTRTGKPLPKEIVDSAKKVGNERLSKACKRALEHHVYNYKIIDNILKRGLDQLEEEPNTGQQELPFHKNIRGNKYYK